MCGDCCTFKRLHPQLLVLLGIEFQKSTIIASLTHAWALANIALGYTNNREEYEKRKESWNNEEIVYGEAIDVPENYWEIFERIEIKGVSLYRCPFHGAISISTTPSCTNTVSV